MHDISRLSGPLRRFAGITAVLILLTSSFDIFLIVNAGGNYRFCQIVAPLLIALAIVKCAWIKTIRTLGALPLCIWVLFQLSFIPATGFWPKSIGYWLWLLLNVGLVFSYVQLFSDNDKSLTAILRWYVYSFGVIAVFGMVQIALPLFGLPGLFVMQWWVPDILARANGFSYEPSYFATYLLIGFVLVNSLRRAKSKLLSSRALLALSWITAIGIVISSSRMGIAFLLVDIFLSQLNPWVTFAKSFRKARITASTTRALLVSFSSLCLIAAISAGALLMLESNAAVMLMFLNGTGISDTAAHSVIQRENAFADTLTVFVEHPFIGRSLGGVSSAIADLEGETVRSFEDSKQSEGMNVFAEVLAASGSIGFIPFVWFLLATIWKPLKLARTAQPPDASLLRALVRSLIFAWGILQFNQNMLRPYLWVHIAILAAVYAAALRHSKRDMQVRNQL